MYSIRIGHLSTFYHTAILLMSRPDFPLNLGCGVSWRLFGTGPAIVNAFEKDELDLAYIGLPPAIIGIDRGVDIRCIAGGHIEGTVISAKAQYRGFPELKDLQAILRQFAGLRIGVPGKGSIHDVILREYLSRLNLDNDVELVNFAWADLVTEAMARDEVDAAVGTPALAVAVRRFAGGKVLYPPSLLWPWNPSYGIIARKDLLDEKRAVVEKFLSAHEDAAEMIRKRPAEASRIIASFVGFIDEEFVMDTLMISPKYCAQLPEAYISSTMDFVSTLKRLGYIRRSVRRDEIFDTSLIRTLHPEKDHYRNGIAA
ncbi:MAG: ABC transporter substrate-binding protein [Nitrospirae bacterium]|nr:ABC transporter substrate-binding protein [Nitrospirota bacterium]